MATVLGPTAINERNFTVRSTKCKALGLLWDTEAGFVSIPPNKIEKALGRVSNLINSVSTSKTAILETNGSLRHVASCSTPARAFLQALQSTASTFPRFRPQRLSAQALDDFHWFRSVLQYPGYFNQIPVGDLASVAVPTSDVFMDTSGEGLYVLEPTWKENIRQRFAELEAVELSINIREMRSAVLATLHWGPFWAGSSNTKNRVHVTLHIGNTSAVSWTNCRTSRHPDAQMNNRLLSPAGFQYNTSFSATHIPGKVMADAGS
ncbi:hypothetical protein L916_10035, partial [Phytophthora nicotianae]